MQKGYVINMKLPMSWLGDYMNIENIDPKTYEHEMTMSGSKVEGIESAGKNLKNIVTGKILKIEKHPDAEKLVVCQVDIKDEEVQIVTAAKNVFEGAVVPVAKHKSVLADGTKITKGKLRGVLSQGMFCSTDELGLTDNVATGIMILDENTPLGIDICEALDLNENVVEFEITSNRPDCMSIIGLARETAATFNLDFNVKTPQFPEASENSNDYASVEIEDYNLCPRFVGRVLKNVKIGPSPKWMQKRLNDCGIRAINNIVDITNYIMLEYGQPMHAYDLDNVCGKKIIVRRAKDGEMLETLDDQPRTLDSSMIVISDTERAIGVAGVMGGANTEVTDSTTTVLFEAANFEGIKVRLAAKKLGMRTDASALFEKGLDPENVLPAINRACELAHEMNAGEVLSGIIEKRGEIKPQRRLPFEPDKMNKFLGTDISSDEMVTILKKLEFGIEDNTVIVPTFRNDIESMADIAEEVVRIYGYNKIPSTMMKGNVTAGGKTERQKLEDKIKNSLVSSGLYEIMTYSFIDPKEYNLIGIEETDPRCNFVKITNPLGEENSVMRTTMLSTTLEVLQTNYNKRNSDAALFEIGKIYIPKDGEELPSEPSIISIGMYGNYDFYDLKGIVEKMLSDIGIYKVKFEADTSNPSFHPGRCAKLYIGNKCIGTIGQIHPKVTKAFKIGTEVYMAELCFETISEFASFKKSYKALPKFPGTDRDIAVVVDESVTVGSIADIFDSQKSSIIESYELFDVYRGSQLGENKKSVAYSVKFRASDRTLTDDEVNSVMENILSELKTKLNAELR